MSIKDRKNLSADTENGCTKTADLLFEALTMARLNGVQKGICLFLWQRTYGWGRKEDKITLKEFARACGTDEPYVCRQIKKLINWKIIFRTSYEPGKAAAYSMNTSIAEWDKCCIDIQELTECTVQGLYNSTTTKKDLHESAIQDLHRSTIQDLDESSTQDLYGSAIQDLHGSTIQDLYDCTIQGLHECTKVEVVSDQESQGIESSLKTNRKKEPKKEQNIKQNKKHNKKHNKKQNKEEKTVSSSLTTTTGRSPVKNNTICCENDDRAAGKDLTAELTGNYQVIQGISESKGDYAFIGDLYNEHGYEQVLTAIKKLKTAAAARELKQPLLYLKGILAKSKPKGGPASGCNSTPDRRKNSETPAEFKISARYAHLIN